MQYGEKKTRCSCDIIAFSTTIYYQICSDVRAYRQSHSLVVDEFVFVGTISLFCINLIIIYFSVPWENEMQFTAKNESPFTLLNGQAGIDVNDRFEVAKILHTQPKTIVFVFAGGRQTGDKEFTRDTLHQCHNEGSEKIGGCLFFLGWTTSFWSST